MLMSAGHPQAVAMALPPSPPPLRKRDPRVRSQCIKTRLCVFFEEGRCNKGDACDFAHGADELERPVDLRKTSICKQWEKNQCRRNAAQCRFAHGSADLRRTTTHAGTTVGESSDGEDQWDDTWQAPWLQAYVPQQQQSQLGQDWMWCPMLVLQPPREQEQPTPVQLDSLLPRGAPPQPSWQQKLPGHQPPQQQQLPQPQVQPLAQQQQHQQHQQQQPPLLQFLCQMLSQVQANPLTFPTLTCPVSHAGWRPEKVLEAPIDAPMTTSPASPSLPSTAPSWS